MELGKTQPYASPEEALEHHGVKGQKWGVRKEEDSSPRDTAARNEAAKGRLTPDSPEFKERIGRVTRTDRPQTVTSTQDNSRVTQIEKQQSGLTNKQKAALAAGGVGLAALGYVAYKHYVGNVMPGLEAEKILQEQRTLEGLTLPKHWDVSGLKNGPISKQRLGDLAGGEFNAKLKDLDDLVINTSRGYADIQPKFGFENPHAVARHASVTKVLEEMREKYPTIRNMNIEVVPMSKVPGLEGSTAEMAVMAMRAGEARVMYNDLTDLPSARDIRSNARFLPGLGKKDYVAYHEMGHLLTAAHGELPASFDLLSGAGGNKAWKTWEKAEPLLHKKMFAKHGLSFKELSKLSDYAATQPAEAMAEAVGHYLHPEMRGRLSAAQLKRVEAMVNEMGGLA